MSKLEYESNTRDFIQNNKPNLYYKWIDFMTVKIQKDLDIIKKIDDTIQDQVYIEGQTNNKVYKMWMFNIVYYWLVFWNQIKIYNVLDQKNNLVIQIRVKQDTWKKNNNVTSNIEFKGVFFRAYKSKLHDILSIFKVDLDKPKIMLRIDYCIDLQNIKLEEIEEYKKEYNGTIQIIKQNNDINDMIRDIKKVNKPTIEIQRKKNMVYKKYKTERNELKIYDKRFDIFMNHLYTRVDNQKGLFYKHYLDSEVPITRVELKKKSRSIRELWLGTINDVLDKIETLFYNYIKRVYNIDFFLIDKEAVKKAIYKKLDKKIDCVDIKKSLEKSINMMLAYAKRIEALWSRQKLIKVLDSHYHDDLYNKLLKVEVWYLI